jgi:lipoate-protein ligase A
MTATTARFVNKPLSGGSTLHLYSTDASGSHKVPALTLYEDGYAAELDTGVSHSLLRMVAENGHDGSLRLYRPGDMVAFGKRDAVTGGFDEAVAAAGRRGFASVIRLAGGRAAVFHEGTIAFALTIPTPAPREDITGRFRSSSELIAGALGRLGVPARIGEVPGEYCPGEYSINAGGKKVVGIGQRLINGAAHVGGVIVVDGGKRIADVLDPVYRALGLTWDPETAGDLVTAVPGLRWDEVRDAVLQAFASIADVRRATMPAEVLERAATLAGQHRAAPPTA